MRLHVSELIRKLRERHEIRVLSYRLPEQTPRPEDEAVMRLVPAEVRSNPAKVAAMGRAVLRRRPYLTDALVEGLRGPLAEELDRFGPDVVHVAPGRMAGLADVLGGRPAVLDAIDAWHLNVRAAARAARGLRRLTFRDEEVRVRRFEATRYRRFGRVVVVSDADRDALLALDPWLAVEVVPNGVDVDAFRPSGGPVDPDRLLFTGVLSYPSNVLAAEFAATRVVPLVRRLHPSARLAIVGRSPGPRVRALAELPGVEVIGDVPDLRVWLTGSTVALCPMVSGTGIKNKLLEAMACGVACVATPRSLQSLDVTPGVQVLVGADARELADAVVRVLSDPSMAARLGAAARQHVVDRFSWRAAADAYERIYREVTG
jgi:polysaccharide biosynthesis protein PslH